MTKEYEKKVKLLAKLDEAIYNVLKNELSKDKPRAEMVKCALRYVRLNKESIKKQETAFEGLDELDLIDYPKFS
jgi:hypothetical protein